MYNIECVTLKITIQYIEIKSCSKNNLTSLDSVSSIYIDKNMYLYALEYKIC